MSDFNEQRQEETAAGELRPVANRSRRRLLHGGLGVTPALLTLVSRPVLAQQCFTPSGFVSMPTSAHGTPQYCLGRSPDFWMDAQNFSQWPTPPYYPVRVTGPSGHEPTRFNSVFLPSPYSNPTTSFLEVLQTSASPTNDVARYMVATALNIAKGWVPVLTLLQLQTMWKQYMDTGAGTAGYFEPTAGVTWNYSLIIEYLKSLGSGA